MDSNGLMHANVLMQHCVKLASATVGWLAATSNTSCDPDLPSTPFSCPPLMRIHPIAACRPDLQPPSPNPESRPTLMCIHP